MPKVDRKKVVSKTGSSYPPPFDEPCRERRVRRLGDAVGLTQFGVNLVTLPPGAWSSQRHWHECEDEFVFVLEGEVVLIEDSGETSLRAGDSAGWPAGVRDGTTSSTRASTLHAFWWWGPAAMTIAASTVTSTWSSPRGAIPAASRGSSATRTARPTKTPAQVRRFHTQPVHPFDSFRIW